MKFDGLVSALSNYHVVLEPDKNEPEWWAGAPSVVYDDGMFYMACRMREGNSPRGLRGYETRILSSTDGLHFEPIKHILREQAHVPGFERPALVKDPRSGMFKMYLSSPMLTGGWSILKLADARRPSEFDATTAEPIIVPERHDDGLVHVISYKDPVVLWAVGSWHMFVIGADVVERISHFVSDNGDDWTELPGPILQNDGWHNFYTRPASVIPITVGYLFVYEGSNAEWRDPVYNIATGLAYSSDLTECVDLTPSAPLLTSTTPGDYLTWRYSHWLPVGDRLFVYFEASRPNNTNEIRVAVVPAIDLAAIGFGALPQTPPETLSLDWQGTEFLASSCSLRVSPSILG